MAQEQGPFRAALSVASGDDPALQAEFQEPAVEALAGAPGESAVVAALAALVGELRVEG